MSWSGFKKNVGRATTQVMMKTGHVEKTSDRQYEVEERRYRTLESAATRLQKEAKGYLDSLRAMTASQMRIAETIDAFYGDSGAQDGVSRSYKQAVEDLDAETVKALDGPYRCVPTSFHHLAVNHVTGEYDESIIREIEEEMNIRDGKKRSSHPTPIQTAFQEFDRTYELMDHVYRTTVLEPINRFCAYFPDINESIKKRNHKMLDYDAMRSKVKKLTEKPDKDASKLPRAEKEADMVSEKSFLDETPLSPTTPSTAEYIGSRNSIALELDSDLDLLDTLALPSPPKALQRPDIEKHRRAEQAFRIHPIGYEPILGVHHASDRRRSRLKGGLEGNATYLASSVQPASTPGDQSCRHTAEKMERPSTSLARRSTSENVSSPPPKRQHSQWIIEGTNMRPATGLKSTGSSTKKSTPFFQPSELEDIMRPLRDEFMQKQADKLLQAKAAYEQLNEQLTSELPQIIDLRVPYLDPSFEALVKIQLRFCAEAYSRMAQVQQYLDASTRDQYASGDLDARVEDVLGQIRELSIAGTV